jgi:hypothetical protein
MLYIVANIPFQAFQTRWIFFLFLKIFEAVTPFFFEILKISEILELQRSNKIWLQDP